VILSKISYATTNKIKHTLNIHENAANKELLSHIIKNLQARYNMKWNGAPELVPMNKQDQIPGRKTIELNVAQLLHHSAMHCPSKLLS